ncbi:endolytic transglycosylase MltG [Agaribacter flavus]|uniref:Endolytic murein transglycosylase n=1 Tax=Agaribacter flavus TaxID=1902781 RepID=A0ABV7FMQ9_9ALTE
MSIWIKRFLILTFILACAAFASAFYVLNQANKQMHYVANQDVYLLHVERGDNALGLFNDLNETFELGANPLLFKVWLRLNSEKAVIKKGVYEIPKSSRLVDVFERVSSGNTKQFSITLIEGQTIKQWYQQIKRLDSLQQDLPNIQALYDTLIGAEGQQNTAFCENKHASIEGCLLPDTYYYSYKDSALSILHRAFRAMSIYIEDSWQQRFQDLPIPSMYEALILASIVEKETGLASERDLIAGVFVNRLLQNMRLQTDPTVIYGIGDEFDGNITRKHLRAMTPYNTYRIKGLPITPIAMSSRDSIMAALRPASTEYLYFVSKGDGSHQFSETLDEHNAAVRRYQLNKK